MTNIKLDELYSSVQFTEIYGQLIATALSQWDFTESWTANSSVQTHNL